jgi:hypothetical protein
MNAKTRHLLSEYLFNKSADEALDEEDRMDLYEQMEDSVWGVFEDWENEDWEAANAKIVRIKSVYGD